MRRRLLHLLLTSLGLILLSGQTPGQDDLAELIHFGDLVEVDVIGSYDYDWRGSINGDGFLDGLDALENPIYALCRSESDVALAIARQLKTLRDPKVGVRILDRSSRAVAFLSGAVRSPKRFQIKRRVNLSELLVLSGGITDRASGEISIFRPPNLNCTAGPKQSAEGEFVKASQPGGTQTLNIKIADILRGDPSANPQILSGDIVTVNEALPVYVIGGVNAPQQIPLRNELTLSRAVSTAGGLAKEGNTNITVFRREGRETRLLQADLQKITAGTAQDLVLRPFDIVDVPQKGKPARSRAPVIDKTVSQASALSALPLQVID